MDSDLIDYARGMVIAHRAHERKRTSGGKFFHEEGGHFCDMMAEAAREGYSDALARIEALEAELAEKEAAMVALRDDLLMRAEAQRHMNGGELVVEASNGVWIRFNDAIGRTEQPNG